MAGVHFAIYAFIACLCIAVHVHADVSTCTFKDPSTGKLYDFSTLINPEGYYTFNQTVWSIGGFSLDSLVADTQVPLTFYLQICHNLPTPPPGCKDSGALYTIAPDGTCLSWGQADVAMFDLNPYKDGVNMKLYHGTAIDHLSYNSAIIFFVCASAEKPPMFEHVKASINQAHFKIFTPLACSN